MRHPGERFTNSLARHVKRRMTRVLWKLRVKSIFYLFLEVSQSQLLDFVGKMIVEIDCSGEEALGPEAQP